MSNTSTSYSRHKKTKGGQKENESETRSSTSKSRTSRSRTSLLSGEFYSEGEKSTQLEGDKWSSNKLKHELSTLIAEFSYLNDTKNKPQNDPPPKENPPNTNTPQQNIQVFAAKTEQMSTVFQAPEERKKGVEWGDQNKGTIAYSVQDTCYNDPPVERVKRTKRTVIRRPRMRVRKSCSVKRSKSRECSVPQRKRSTKSRVKQFSGFRASKSRSRRRARSCESERRPLTPMRRRVRKSRSRIRKSSRCRTPTPTKSYIRRIPLRVSRRKRTQEIVIKKSKPKVVYKTIEPCAEPTLITLYPQPIRRRPRPRRVPSREPGLPCKCDMCTNKYRSLARLYRDQCFNACAPISCAPISCAPICAPRPPMCSPRPPMCFPCSPRYQIIPRDYSPCSPSWRCKTGFKKYNRPWANQCFKDSCCPQPLQSRCVKSVCYKFGATSQCLNSNITHYFHSILDRGGCF